MNISEVCWGQTRGIYVAVFSYMMYLVVYSSNQYAMSVQAMLIRHQDKLEGRVQNIDEQLTKLESDKTLMKVQEQIL